MLVRVLLVEDEKDIQFIVTLALERSEHFDVTLFESGEQALQHLDGMCCDYDIALVNFRLPAMHGLDFIRAMRAKTACQHLPAIILTAALMDAERKEFHGQGILGVISKPFDPILLPQQILTLYAEAQNRNSPDTRSDGPDLNADR